LNFANDYDSYFAGNIHVNFNVNTGSIYKTLLKLCLGTVSKNTQDIVKVLGEVRTEWQPLLLQTIRRSEVTEKYGGTGNYPETNSKPAQSSAPQPSSWPGANPTSSNGRSANPAPADKSPGSWAPPNAPWG